MCTSDGIELLLNGGYFGRHLGFRTLRIWRKNVTLFCFKTYEIFFQNQM